MRIDITRQPHTTLVEFANRHGLILEIHERDPIDTARGVHRFYAGFAHCDVKDGHLLCGTCGNGASPHLAAEDYAIQISGRLLVVDALDVESRREIRVPRLSDLGLTEEEMLQLARA